MKLRKRRFQDSFTWFGLKKIHLIAIRNALLGDKILNAISPSGEEVLNFLDRDELAEVKPLGDVVILIDDMGQIKSKKES